MDFKLRHYLKVAHPIRFERVTSTFGGQRFSVLRKRLAYS